MFPLALSVLALGPAEEVKQVKVGPGVVLEVGAARRVIVRSTVVLRKGPLEGLLTRARKKEHEYILAADVDARHVHAALELARAKAGNPVRFQPKYRPAEGTPIRVTLRYDKGGKQVTVAAAEWIREDATDRPLGHDWVFAGSRFGPNPEGDDKPPFYLANHGDLICVCNLESALLDLPVRSPKALKERRYKADPGRIPEVGTRVDVILEPVSKKGPGGRPR